MIYEDNKGNTLYQDEVDELSFHEIEERQIQVSEISYY